MKKALVLALAGAMSLSLMACGSSASSTESATEAPAAETAAEETTEASAEAASEEQENEAAAFTTLTEGVLTVGTNAEFPPFEYVGDDGEPDGFDIALIKAIGEKMGIEVQVENMEFDSLVTSIGSKIDVAIAGMTVTEERQASVDFSDSYYDAVQSVIVPADSEIATIEDLQGLKIGAQLGTTGEFIIEDDIEGAEAATYNKAVDAVNDLINGKLDAVIVDRNPASVFAEKFPDDVKALNGEDFGFAVEQYAIAVPKGDTALLDAINAALAEVQEDGTFDALVAQYIEEGDASDEAASTEEASEEATEAAADETTEEAAAEATSAAE
ncbi:MAG: basic amino acid ABC transporter substrate-binding protein [Eubacteriales bacterium]|nr:basic amino acid ABC transporter substrate-binding protein [Eubacteriales bacterium]